MSCHRCPEDAGCCRYCCDCHDEGHVSGYRLGRAAGLREAAALLTRLVPEDVSHRTAVSQAKWEAAQEILALATGGSDGN